MESFVDVTYRGLEVGRRVKLTEVSAGRGYIEVAIPMPVGTRLDITVDDGLSFGAIVRGVHEQVSGSPRPPGMAIAPELAGEPAQKWWAERITVTAAPPARAPRTAPIAAVDAEAARAAAERDRKASGAPPIAARTTRPMPSPEVQDVVVLGDAASVYEDLARKRDDDGLVDDGKKTEVMETIDPEMLAKLMSSGDTPALVDDDKRTTVMDAPAVPVEDSSEDSGGNGGGPDDPGASGPMPAQGKRKKRRRR